MNIKIRNMGEFCIALALVSTLVIAGCGGGGGGGGGGGSAGNTATSNDVKAALNQTLKNGTVVITQLQRKDQTKIQAASVSYVAEVTNAPGFNDGLLTPPLISPATDISGNTSTTLPAGAQKQVIWGASLNETLATGAASAVNAVVGMTANGVPGRPVLPITVASATLLNSYRGEEYQWNITTPAASSVSVTVVQVDPATTKPDYGTFKYRAQPFGGANYIGLDARDPTVLKVSRTLAAGVTTKQINTEFLPGSYQVIISALDGAGVPVAAPYVSGVITSTTATASSGTPTAKSITLAAGRAVSLTLVTTGGAGILNKPVDFYDAATLLPLGSATTNASGSASVTVPTTTTSVIAQVWASTAVNAPILTTYVFSNVGTTASVTLKEQPVSGAVSANTTCALGAPVAPATTIGTVTAVANSTVLPWNSFNPGVTALVSTSGAYSLTLFGDATGAGIAYTLSANNIVGCPDATLANITVIGAAVSQNITVAGGGTIVGKISTKAGGALPGIGVQIWQSTTAGYRQITTAITDGSGNYQVQVPYGTYMLWADGSVTENIVVSTSSSAIKNLTQYQLLGTITKGVSTNASSGATVYVGAQSALATNIGVYNITVMEGKTWFCVVPAAAEGAYAYQCNLNVLVNAANVTAAGQ